MWSQAPEKIERFSRNGEGTGLKINIRKTKVLRLNTERQGLLWTDCTEIEDVISFVYL